MVGFESGPSCQNSSARTNTCTAPPIFHAHRYRPFHNIEMKMLSYHAYTGTNISLYATKLYTAVLFKKIE